jgi:ligand-binding sensor domain-containing protein
MSMFRGRRRALHTVLHLAGLSGAVSGCSLDFDQFKEATQEPDVRLIDVGGPTGGAMATDGPNFQDAAVDLGTTDQGVTTDTDGDGVTDDQDNCPMAPNPGQEDGDGDGDGDACDGDTDGDGVPPDQDNCPDAPNPDQLDFDRDGQGDACDADPDGDGLDEATEAMRGTSPRAADTDGDGLADGADTCPTVADRAGLDKNGDGVGDACDPDDDGDGVPDWRDTCAQTPNPDQADSDADGTGDACAADIDGDGVANETDNCPAQANPAQGAADCRGRFQRLTYGRDVRAVRGTASGAVAATAGGIGLVDDAQAVIRSTADGLADNPQHAIAQDAQGNLWVVADGSVSVYKRNGTAVRLGPRDEGGGPQGRLRAVAVDPNGVAYVGGDAGLNVYANGTWSLLTAPQLPSADVRGLWLSPGGQVWAATAAGAVRLVNGAVERTVTGLAGVGDVLNAVSGEADGSVWLLGENGAVHLPSDGGNVPLATYTGFSARDLTVGPNGNRYLATGEGLRRIDADGRLFPPGAALLPSGDVRSVGAHEAATPWIGTSEGLVRLDGYFASVTAEAGNFVSPCVNATARIGSLLWIGTNDGLYVMNPDGTYRKLEGALPLPLVRVIRQVGQTVWVGTDGGVGLFGLDATPQGQLTPADGLPVAPISDIVAGVDEQVWIASAGNGIVRRNADNTFTAFTRESAGNNFLSNQVKALAHDGGMLWVGTDAGVSVWSEAAGAFQFPVTNQGGQLPDVRVQDLAVGGGLVYVATPQGVAVRRADNTWTTLRRATGGWPNSTGSDFAWSVAHDGEGLWVMLDDSQRQPTGVLLRRIGLDPLPENSEGGETVKMYTAANAGLVAAKGSAVKVEWSGQELFTSWCGAADDVGGFSVLDGRGAVVRDVSAGLGLPKGAGASALTIGPDGQPLYSAARTEATPFALSLTTPADATSPPGQVPFVLPPSVTGVLRKCAQAPGSGELWCALSGVGVGRRLDAQMWVVLDETRIRDLAGGDVRDIAVDGPQSIWIATGTGVIRLNQGNPRLYNTAGTAGGLPSDDVRAVALGAGGTLLAATAAGIGVFDPGTMTWTAIGRTPGGLGNGDVRAVAVAADGTAYFGTADGLFRRGVDGTFTDFHAARGLPSNDVRSVAVHPDGRVLVGTAGGLAIGTPAGADLTFTVAGFADGLPGRAVLDITTAADGRIWVRSDDGVALLAN